MSAGLDLASNLSSSAGEVISAVPPQSFNPASGRQIVDPSGEAGQGMTLPSCRLVVCQVSDLRPHPSYVKHGLSVPAFKINALDRLGNLAFQDPIVVTQDRLIVDGYARWELAKKRGMVTILCLVYQRTEDEALRDFLWRHRRFDGLNDFTRIEVGRDLKSFSREKARLNQQAGGQRKGLAKLEASERVDSRKERAQTLGVSQGNVSKVDRILEHACSSTKQAARDKEISIHRADQWSRETEEQQIENLRVLRIERGLRKKARLLVAGIVRSKPDEEVLTMAHLFRLLERLSTMWPEQSREFGPVVIGCLDVPWKGIYVTDGLVRSFKRQQEVLVK